MRRASGGRLRILRPVDEIPITRTDFSHGLARCPRCGLPLDAAKDVDELLRDVAASQPLGARMTHRECGASFLVRLED